MVAMHVIFLVKKFRMILIKELVVRTKTKEHFALLSFLGSGALNGKMLEQGLSKMSLGVFSSL